MKNKGPKKMQTESPNQEQFEQMALLFETATKISLENFNAGLKPLGIFARTLEILSLQDKYMVEYNIIFQKLVELCPTFTPEEIINRLSNNLMGKQNSYGNSNWSLDQCLTIAFEGIDATGKQTLSGMLKNFLEFTKCFYTIAQNDFYSSLYPNQQFIKVNIPNYESASGIRIKNYLNKGNYDPKLLQLEFAINRKEVQNLLVSYNKKALELSGGFETTKVCIFDRWVDSGVAFKLAKVLVNEARAQLSSISMVTLFDKNSLENFLCTSYGTELWNEYIDGQEEIEYNTLGLIKPNFKVLCTSPSAIIAERLIARAEACGIPLDEHEKDLEFLEVVQNIYSLNLAKQYTRDRQKYLIIDTSLQTKEECAAEIILKLITNQFNQNTESDDFSKSFSELCKLSEQINNL